MLGSFIFILVESNALPLLSFSCPFYFLPDSTLGMLRSRFQSLPGAFNACMIPEEKSKPAKKKGLQTILSRNLAAVVLPRNLIFFFLLLLLLDLLSDNSRKCGKHLLVYLSNSLFQIPSNEEKEAADLLNCGTLLSAVLERRIL